MEVKPSIVLEIEELTLHGFPAGDRSRIGDAVGRELRRLLQAQGAPAGLRDERRVDRIDGGQFTLQQATPPEVIGAQIAQALYEGWKR